MKSQNTKILEHLKKHQVIEPMTALDRYGCFRLAARIAELRMNYDIQTETIERGTKRFARYRLIS
jgi:hypothetical protein